MANIHILARSEMDRGALSGGAWLAGLPLANLLNPQPKRVCRSVDATQAGTRFVVDLGRARQMSMFALIATNLSKFASWRIRVSNAADGSTPVLDVIRNAFEPNIVWGSLTWGAFAWDGFSEDLQPGGNITFYRHANVVLGRYLLIDIADPLNPDGYIEIGRAMAGEAFVPAFNMTYGVTVGFIDESKKSRSVGGQVYSDRKPKRRRMVCGFDALNDGEAYGAIYDMLNDLGTSGNLLVIYDPEDTAAVLSRRSLYGQMTDLAEIETANSSTRPYRWRLAVEELI